MIPLIVFSVVVLFGSAIGVAIMLKNRAKQQDAKHQDEATPPIKRDNRGSELKDRKPSELARTNAVVRDLDAASHKELLSAFADNPIAARKKYESVRWQVKATVFEIDPFKINGEVCIRVGLPLPSTATVSIWVAEHEAARLKTRAVHTFEFRIRDYSNIHLEGGIEFKDGTVVN